MCTGGLEGGSAERKHAGTTTTSTTESLFVSFSTEKRSLLGWQQEPDREQGHIGAAHGVENAGRVVDDAADAGFVPGGVGVPVRAAGES